MRRFRKFNILKVIDIKYTEEYIASRVANQMTSFAIVYKYDSTNVKYSYRVEKARSRYSQISTESTAF